MEDVVSIRVALVGGGFALHTQLPAFRRVPGVLVTDLVGRDRERVRRLAAQHEIPRSSVSLAETLGRDDIDLVCVTTPPDLHREMAEASLRAGKHVLCEKPLALDAGQGESMCRVAAAARRLACVDHQLRFAPNLVRLRQLLRDGYVGRPLHAELQLRIGSRLDRRRPHDWWSESRRGGGALGALGSHAIDLLRWFLGDVHSVGAALAAYVGERYRSGDMAPARVDSDDHAAFMLRFAGAPPVIASVVVSAVSHRAAGLRLELFGDAGMLRFDEAARLWGSRRDAEARSESAQPPLEDLTWREPVGAEDLRSVPDTLFGRSFLLFARAMVATLEGGGDAVPGAATFADGLAVQRVLDAAGVASRERRWVDVPMASLED
jgi:predicted dehydrogenase